MCCEWPGFEDLYVEVEDNPELSEGSVVEEYAGQ
jgi:hypothetical protein